MKKSQFFILVFTLIFVFQLKSQITYYYDYSKNFSLLNEIKNLDNSDFKPALLFISHKIQKVKSSPFFSGDRSIFDSLFYIPVYNVQLNIKLNEKTKSSEKYYQYSLELYENKPINRILIFNNHNRFIGTMYLLKDIFYTDFAFICYNIPYPDNMNYSVFACFDLNQYSSRFISIIKKQIKNKTLPVYFHINNFSDELFFINNSSVLYVLANKSKVLKADTYFKKKFEEKDLINKSEDTLFKYIYKECLKDTTIAK